MRRLVYILIAGAAFFSRTPISATADTEPSAACAGSLVIAGGALSQDTEDVWHSFIEKARPEGPIVIVPSASGSPVESASSAMETLLLYGVDSTRVEIAKLANQDDRSTPDTDESKWSRNSDDPSTVALLEGASAVWFTGGDQSRTVDILTRHGEDTPALAAIRRASSRGAPIGGTSAGAAIMSERMLLQGDSLSALTGSDEGEALQVGDGLGFFSYGIVDQHFAERARLGRLIAALAREPDTSKRLGFGVDENTALLVSEDGSACVGGRGYITIVDARKADFAAVKDDRLKVSGLMIHLVAAGDWIDLRSLTLRPARWKAATIGHEYVASALPGGGGMAVQGHMLQDVIGEGLIDNQAAGSVERLSFDRHGRGIVFKFSQLPQSAGFWGSGPDRVGRYAIANIHLDIVPVTVKVETIE